MKIKDINSTILKATLYTAAFVGVFTITSCNQNIDSKDTKEIAQDSNDAKFSDTKEEDAAYLVTAAGINLEEIQLGQLAQKNSTMPQVIELGAMMENEHAKALEILKTLAAQKHITIPTTLTNDGKDTYDDLKNKFGPDFDNEYCDMMVKGHKDAISKFEEASIEAKDADIKSWSEAMLISYNAHLIHAIACQKECAKVKTK